MSLFISRWHGLFYSCRTYQCSVKRVFSPVGQALDKAMTSWKELTIYIGESARWHHQPLYVALIETARKQGLAGAKWSNLDSHSPYCRNPLPIIVYRSLNFTIKSNQLLVKLHIPPRCHFLITFVSYIKDSWSRS